MKCIICGGEISFEHNEMAESYSRADFIFGSCNSCGWRTLGECESEESVKEEIRKWFATFPPILRIQEGDVLSYYTRFGERKANAKVLEVRRIRGLIKTSSGNCTCDDVVKWPWEFEQKGGE